MPVSFTGPPDVSVSPLQVSVGKGDSVNFSCVTFAVPAITSFRWKGPSGVIPQSNADSGEKYRLDGMTLTVATLSTVDNGTYTCEVRNEHGNNTGKADLMVLGEFVSGCGWVGVVCACE